MILGAYSLPKKYYDGHALEPTIKQVERVSGYRPAVAIGDKRISRQNALWHNRGHDTRAAEKERHRLRETKGQSSISQTGSD